MLYQNACNPPGELLLTPIPVLVDQLPVGSSIKKLLHVKFFMP
jgi:hypothetical protein